MSHCDVETLRLNLKVFLLEVVVQEITLKILHYATVVPGLTLELYLLESVPLVSYFVGLALVLASLILPFLVVVDC